jgi:beta-glucosidase-like glycosyl hydrolase
MVPFFVFGETLEEILGGMTLEEKVGQLFVAPACPLHKESHLEDWKNLLEMFHIGGVLVKQSGAEGPGRFLHVLQEMSDRPLLVVADAEWGLSMSMKDALIFPRNMTLGAIQDLTLIERLGTEIGKEALQAGIHMNLAPVIDINNNPQNPVIHMRSFGDNPVEVAKRGDALIRGMKKSGLLSCVKHFPGHGDTHVDSHVSLPTLPHSLARLFEVELIPFQSAIAAHTDAVMSAHVLLPKIDLVPATLSYPMMTTLLRDQLGFDGLILTDALNMKALTTNYSTAQIVIGAHAAGVDLLLYGAHEYSDVDYLLHELIPTAYLTLLKAYQDGQFPIERLNASILRILQAKGRTTVAKGEEKLMFQEEAFNLQKLLYQAAVTQIGPDFAPLDPDVAYLSIGGQPSTDLLLSAFCPCLCSSWEHRADMFEYDRVVISLRGLEPRLKNYGLTEEHLQFFKELSSKKSVVFCLFGTPYAVRLLPKNSTILIGFEEEAQQAVLEILSGEQKPIGLLPIQF